MQGNVCGAEKQSKMHSRGGGGVCVKCVVYEKKKFIFRTEITLFQRVEPSTGSTVRRQ